ncbi:hypothetical protein HZS_2741 [Henneguya salminicola]|nr:hypothetical protein HZS_2741 [Henneguya salminicola]
MIDIQIDCPDEKENSRFIENEEFFEFECIFNVKFSENLQDFKGKVNFYKETLFFVLKNHLYIVKKDNYQNIDCHYEIINFEVVKKCKEDLVLVCTARCLLIIDWSQKSILAQFPICEFLGTNESISHAHALDSNTSIDLVIRFTDQTGLIFVNLPLTDIISQQNNKLKLLETIKNAQAFQYDCVLGISLFISQSPSSLITLTTHISPLKVAFLIRDHENQRYIEEDTINFKSIFFEHKIIPKKFLVSPCGDYCASLSACGRMAIGLYPLLVFFHQYSHPVNDFIFCNLSECVMAIQNQENHISILSIPSMRSLFTIPTQTCDVFDESSSLVHILVLEAFREEPKTTLKITRLYQTTVEERFRKLIGLSRFEHAQSLADKYNLDTVLMYRRWCLNLLQGITKNRDQFPTLMDVTDRVKFDSDFVNQILKLDILDLHQAIQFYSLIHKKSEDFAKL